MEIRQVSKRICHNFSGVADISNNGSRAADAGGKEMDGVIGPLDTGLDFYRQVLALRGYRQEVLSADIANASTPGYKAMDLDFAAALKAASADTPQPGAPGPVWLVDDPRDLSPGAAAPGSTAAAAAGAVKYQAGTEVTLDGNSVDLDQEKVAAAENGVDYEAAATFATQTIRMLTVAINGSAAQQAGGA